MKKIILSMGVLALASLGACSNKEKEADTTGAVPAEVVATDVESADIIISEDTVPAPVTDDASQAQEDLKDATSDAKAAVKEAGDALEEKGTELKEKGKEKLAEGANKVSEKAAKVADKLSE